MDCRVGLVHMNGRLYDLVVGRFLSADPFVADPTNAQASNRYSYVLNNPLAYTDPSGYVFKSIQRFFQRQPIAAVIVGGGLAIAIGPTSIGGLGWFSAVEAGAIGGAVAGGLTGGAKGAMFGAANGAITAWIGGMKLPTLEKALAHSVAQGGLSAMEGGDFKNAALAAGFSVIGGDLVDQSFKNNFVLAVASRAVIGGTASVIGGGEFQNGAVTATFVYLFNGCMTQTNCLNPSARSDNPNIPLTEVWNPEKQSWMWVPTGAVADYANSLSLSQFRTIEYENFSRDATAFLGNLSDYAALSAGLSMTVPAAQPAAIVFGGIAVAASATSAIISTPPLGQVIFNAYVDVVLDQTWKGPIGTFLGASLKKGVSPVLVNDLKGVVF